MPDSTALDIPYERQTDPMSNRMCGAAALCMVYRSFQVSCSQAELGGKLTKSGSLSILGAQTYLLAQDALARGLGAIVFRAKDPLRTLKECHRRQLHAILNHRLRMGSPSGHYTVLVDYVGEVVVVHDPQAGPNTRFLQSDLLKLWRPSGSPAEITGNVLVVLGKDQPAAVPCSQCGSTIPDAVACSGCGQTIPLRPASILGCMNAFCPERAWESIFCPHCDTESLAVPRKDFSKAATTKPPATGVPGHREDLSSPPSAKPEGIDTDPLKLQSLSQQIDQFLALLLGATRGRSVPGLDAQVATIRQLQTQMLEVQKTEVVERQAKAAPLPPSPSAPPPEPVAAEPPPRPPVDWNELGRKLVEEIGDRPR